MSRFPSGINSLRFVSSRSTENSRDLPHFLIKGGGRIALCEGVNLLPIEIYMVLVAVIPVGVCFAKWKWCLTWRFATLICAAMSWVYFNLWMMFLDPPDNGFAYAVYFVTGWFWLLPFFGVISVIFQVIESRFPDASGSKVAVLGFRVCAGVTAVIVVWNLGGWMSMERAVVEARHELLKRGCDPRGREIAIFERGSWTVRYPDSDFREIRLMRNGKMLWIGGPG